MSDSPRLGRDVFIALAAVGWADGKLDPDEADAIVRTAADEGLEIEEIEEIEAATKAPIDIGVIDRRNLSKEDRLFVYAVASWMTRLDGEVHEKEQEALRRLGEALEIPEKPREHADAIAREIASLPDGDRPLRYDLARLRATIGERLREAQRLRTEESLTTLRSSSASARSDRAARSADPSSEAPRPALAAVARAAEVLSSAARGAPDRASAAASSALRPAPSAAVASSAAT